MFSEITEQIKPNLAVIVEKIQVVPFQIWKGAFDSQLQVIKFTSCLPMVSGSLRVLRFLLLQKLVAIV
jgi:hypothetical protein